MRRRSRSRAGGRTAARRRRSTTTSGTSRARTSWSPREFGEPNAYEKGFDLADVEAGRYGHRLHFWNLAERKLEQTVDLGENGLLPFEVRWLHDPEAEEGFVGAALSSTMWRFRRDNGGWKADQVIAVEGVELEGWPFPVPGVMSDLVLSMDDRFLYFSNWLHGDLRQYDVSDPANPKLTGRLWLGGVLGKPSDAGRELNGGPQMLQLSLDGRRLYVSNSLLSTWDNQFYPELRSWLLRVNCGPDGGMEVDRDFFVDLHDRPAGPRAHTRCASRTATARRRSSSDRRPHHGDPCRGELLQLVPAGAAMATAVWITGRTSLRRLRRRRPREIREEATKTTHEGGPR